MNKPKKITAQTKNSKDRERIIQKEVQRQSNKERETNFERAENSDGKGKINITECYPVQRKVNKSPTAQDSKTKKDDRKG